jgi:hypothetical protein
MQDIIPWVHQKFSRQQCNAGTSQGNKNNQVNGEEQEDDAEVVMESTDVIFIVDAVDSLSAHDSDAPSNLNSISRMVIRSISS